MNPTEQAPASEQVIETIRKINEWAPVIWDRFTETDGYYVVYGWIARSDGQRDFLVIQMWNTDLPSEAFWITSSAKYSEDIERALSGNIQDHVPCRKIDELLDPETLKQIQS